MKTSGYIIKPKRLNKKDTIGIVAPSSSFDIENFKKGIAKLRSLGYKIRYERAIFNKCWSKSGHNKQRAAQINRMFADKEIKAIFCAKAGYGSEEILSFLNKKIILQNPKIFLGYSDITVLLLYLQKIANMIVFHGPVVSDEFYEGMHQLTIDYLIKLLSRPEPLGTLKFPQLVAFKHGNATGKLVGGNMSLIIGAMGTTYRIQTDNCILFLEDIGEDLEVIRNYFSRLRRSGKFKRIKGLLLGKMIDASGKDLDLHDIINRIFKDYNIPILYGFPSGHHRLRDELHVTLPLGAMVTIDTEKLYLQIDESAVE